MRIILPPQFHVSPQLCFRWWDAACRSHIAMALVFDFFTPEAMRGFRFFTKNLMTS
jgi:hypothetical protein